MVKRFVAALLLCGAMTATASADGVYYLYRTVTILQPYSTSKEIAGGPFPDYMSCEHMLNAEPHNYIPGVIESYACELHF